MTPEELILMHLAIRPMGFNELMRAAGHTAVGASAAHREFPPEKPAKKTTRNPEAAKAGLAEAKSILNKGNNHGA